MSGILRISEAVSIGFHAMVLMARFPDKVLSSKYMALTLKVSEAHLSKVMQRLVRAGLLKSTRGPKGGFQLKEDGDKVTFLQIYEAVEGPVKFNNCLFESPVCGGVCCIMGNLLEKINRIFRDHLANKTLSQLCGTDKNMEAITNGNQGDNKD